MKKIYKRIIIIAVLFIMIDVMLYPFIYSYQCKNRDKSSLEESILSANLYIIKQTDDENGTGYSNGFGGVIVNKKENRYYVLTAYHAIESFENSKFIILDHNELTYNEYSVDREEHIGLGEYYAQFPNAEIEYYNDKYDLAILSFESEKDLNQLIISDKTPQYGEKVISISSPTGEKRNMVTDGKIVSRKPVEFGDDAGKNQYKVVRHSAYEDSGSSGSALLNTDFKIVGINLGGARDIFGNFKYGMAMPSNKIIDFIEEWKLDVKY